jgi:hypothetical protein
VESSDLDTAAKEIETIMEERDELSSSLKEATAHIDELNKEVMETNDVKNITMAMVGFVVSWVGSVRYGWAWTAIDGSRIQTHTIFRLSCTLTCSTFLLPTS